MTHMAQRATEGLLRPDNRRQRTIIGPAASGAWQHTTRWLACGRVQRPRLGDPFMGAAAQCKPQYPKSPGVSWDPGLLGVHEGAPHLQNSTQHDGARA